MLYTIMFSLVWLGTYFGSIYLAENAIKKPIIDLGYKGLKLNKKELKKDGIDLDTDYYALHGPIKNHELLGQILLYTPIVNLIVSLKLKNKINKKLKEVLKNEKYIAPLTKEEKHELLNESKNRNKFKLLKYASNMEYEEYMEKFFPNIDEEIAKHEREMHTIRSDRIINNEFTPEEVKRINAINNEEFKDIIGVLNFGYKLGRVNNENIAVIGLPPDTEKELKDVYMDDTDNKYTFEWYGESYANFNNMKFKIFPYLLLNNDGVKAEVDQIVREHASKDKAARIGITREVEKPTKELNEAPVLKKTQ